MTSTSGPQAAVVVGNPKAGSRTLAAGKSVLEALAAQLQNPPRRTVSIDLAEVSRDLFDWSSPKIRELVETVCASSLVVVASPTYKATYTGLLKSFLDWFGTTSLTRTVVIPLMVGAGAQHALAVEVHLRPLLVELGAIVPVRGLYLLESELDHLDDVLDKWLLGAVPVLDRILTHPTLTDTRSE